MGTLLWDVAPRAGMDEDRRKEMAEQVAAGLFLLRGVDQSDDDSRGGLQKEG